MCLTLDNAADVFDHQDTRTPGRGYTRTRHHIGHLTPARATSGARTQTGNRAPSPPSAASAGASPSPIRTVSASRTPPMS
jgi:hypothetical protein